MMVSLGDLTSFLGQFQQIQENMQRMQEQLRGKTVEATSGGGMVTAKVNGKGELVDLKIDPEAVNANDLEMLEDLVKAAINAALEKSHEQLKQALGELTGQLNIPGLDQLGKLLR